MSTRKLTNAGAVLTIDLGAICDNWRTLKGRLSGADCGAVVKADAYGLGATRVAPALYHAGCRHFFVAHLSEAIELRPHLPADASLYVLHGVHPGAELECVVNDLVPVLNSLAQIEAWRTLAHGIGRHLPAIVQVDTGMARLGLSPEELDIVAADPDAFAGLDLRFIMSHLVSAEDHSAPINRNQLDRFQAALGRLPKAKASLANSSGIFLGDEFHFNLARPGAALYGVGPIAGEPSPMRQVIRLQGKVLQIRTIEAGTPVGYAHTWTAQRRTRIATVAAGYADGYLRSLSNRGQAAFEGIALPLVGNVSMDTITLDVTDVPEARLAEGGLIDLADPLNGVDAIAARAGTIGYEILTSLGSRYARSYIEG